MELVKNIFFNTDKIVEGATVKISYVGYLFQNDSKDVYLHYGYGENWNNIGELKTEKTELGYQAEITIPYGYKTLNLCYKNEVGEWDNNNGDNYIFDIEPCAQNSIETDVDTVYKVETGIVNGNVNEIGTETEVDVELGTGIETGVDTGSYYNSITSDNNTANSYSVYDIYGTSPTASGVTVENVKNVGTAENIDNNGIVGETYLTVTKQNDMELHKGLRKTYLWSKKIKLAIYKIIKYVPKIISGNYKRKVNE